MNKNADDIGRIADKARSTAPVAEAPRFAVMAEAEAGNPRLVCYPDARPAYWIVPYLRGRQACGYARIGLAGEIIQMAVFGAGLGDEASWIEASYFDKPPRKMISEISGQYADLKLSEPLFSFDRNPDKWGWRVILHDGDDIRAVVFIGPGGWYEQRPGSDDLEREG